MDGTYQEHGAELAWEELGHLKTRDVGEVLETVVRRLARYLEKHGVLREEGDSCGPKRRSPVRQCRETRRLLGRSGSTGSP